jgi:hypothetical protein
MANRTFSPHEGALEKRVVDLFGTVTIGSSGAVSASGGAGIHRITKESAAGQYTVVLQDSYNALLWADVSLVDDTDSNPASVAVGTTPKIVIQGYAFDDGADANFADGAKLLIKLTLRNSSVS